MTFIKVKYKTLEVSIISLVEFCQSRHSRLSITDKNDISFKLGHIKQGDERVLYPIKRKWVKWHSFDTRKLKSVTLKQNIYKKSQEVLGGYPFYFKKLKQSRFHTKCHLCDVKIIFCSPLRHHPLPLCAQGWKIIKLSDFSTTF